MWPIHHHTRCSISSCIGRCPACLQSSLIRILLGHQTTRMLLRHLLIKTCNFCFSPLVNLHVSALCKSTAFLFHPSHTWLSPPTPRLLTTHNARRYLESSTSSVSSLTIITRLIPLYEHNRIWPYRPHFINNLTNTFTLNCLDSSRCFLASSFVHEKYYSWVLKDFCFLLLVSRLSRRHNLQLKYAAPKYAIQKSCNW